MIILNTTFNKYKYFLMLHEDKNEFVFNKKIVMVKGRNGSGKTSLFGRLTPLPADKNEFHDGGYQTIEIEHEGNNYKLKSGYVGKSFKYSFLVNDTEELNPAGIVSTQKLLVYQHFGITPIIHDIMVGNVLFTDMTTSARKKLFALLTKLNIDKVLKAYAKLVEECNMNKHLLKNAITQLLLTETKLMSEEDIAKIKDDIKVINDKIAILIETKEGISRYFNHESSESSYNDLSETIVKRDQLIKSNYTLLTSHSPGMIPTILNELNEQNLELNKELSVCYKELEDLHIARERLSSLDIEDIDSLNNRRNQLANDILVRSDHISYLKDLDMTDINNTNCYYTITNNIPNLLTKLCVNKTKTDDYLFSKARLAECRDKLSKVTQAISEIIVEERHLVDRLGQINNHHDKLVCKSCGSEWVMKDLIDLDKETMTINQLTSKKLELIEKQKGYNKYIERCTEYFDAYNRVVRIMKETERFELFWKDIIDEELLLRDPASISGYIDELIGDMSNVQAIIDNNKLIEKINNNIKLHEMLEDSKVDVIDNKISVLDERIRSLRLGLMDNDERIRNAKSASKLHNILKNLDATIKYCKSTVHEYNRSIYTSAINTVVNAEVLDLKVHLSRLETIINDQSSINMVIESQRKTVKDVEERLEVLNALITELSPKNGIIARTTSAFLNTIITNVNLTLDKIWSYKIELLPINLDESDLDYKFRFAVEDIPPADDTTFASKGQKEGINLAFKLMLYKLLGFDKYMLLLDELASSMDDIHTESMTRLIHNFASESNFSQLFIISHKDSMDFLQDTQVVEMS